MLAVAQVLVIISVTALPNANQHSEIHASIRQETYSVDNRCWQEWLQNLTVSFKYHAVDTSYA